MRRTIDSCLAAACIGLAVIFVPGARADQSFSGDVTVAGTLKAREVHSSDGALISERRLESLRKEIVAQAVREVFDAFRFRSTTNDVRAVTDEITANVLKALQNSLRGGLDAGKSANSEVASLKRQIIDLENKQRESERQFSKLSREIDQLRRDLTRK